MDPKQGDIERWVSGKKNLNKQVNTSLSNTAECYDFTRVCLNEFNISASLYSVEFNLLF